MTIKAFAIIFIADNPNALQSKEQQTKIHLQDKTIKSFQAKIIDQP